MDCFFTFASKGREVFFCPLRTTAICYVSSSAAHLPVDWRTVLGHFTTFCFIVQRFTVIQPLRSFTFMYSESAESQARSRVKALLSWL